MTGLLIVVGWLVGLFYFCMVVFIRPMTEEMAAKNRAVKTYVDRCRTAQTRDLSVNAYLSRLDESAIESLLVEAEQWPGWRSELRRQKAAALYPWRRLLWPAVLIATVLAAIIVANLGFGDESTAGDSSTVNWPVLLALVAPWFTTTGAVDLADRIQRRAHRRGHLS